MRYGFIYINSWNSHIKFLKSHTMRHWIRIRGGLELAAFVRGLRFKLVPIYIGFMNSTIFFIKNTIIIIIIFMFICCSFIPYYFLFFFIFIIKNIILVMSSNLYSNFFWITYDLFFFYWIISTITLITIMNNFNSIYSTTTSLLPWFYCSFHENRWWWYQWLLWLRWGGYYLFD